MLQTLQNHDTVIPLNSLNTTLQTQDSQDKGHEDWMQVHSK